jgi:hypothetical protein
VLSEYSRRFESNFDQQRDREMPFLIMRAAMLDVRIGLGQ